MFHNIFKEIEFLLQQPHKIMKNRKMFIIYRVSARLCGNFLRFLRTQN